MAEETKAPSMSGERAFEETDSSKHNKIIAHVNKMKEQYFDSTLYQRYMERVDVMKYMVNQEWKVKSTRFGLMHALMRARHDNIIATLEDLFDVPELIIYNPDTESDREYAKDMQEYTKKLLRNVNYKDHLGKRFAYLPDYGWSIAHDSYQFNEGWVTKVNSKASGIPGLESFSFTREMDVLNDKPNPQVVAPEHWFGNPKESWDKTYQGCLVRWYLKDVIQAMQKKTPDGKHIYNVKALEKVKTRLVQGGNDEDEKYRETGDDRTERSVHFDDVRGGPYVDVIRYYGPLNEISDDQLADDANEYYIECTRDSLLRWTENPADTFTMFTHGRTHAKRNSPFSRSYLDAIKPHQQFTDFMANMSMESIVDNMTKNWVYRPEDLLNPEDFENPKGMNNFLELGGTNAFIPQLLGQERSGAFQDVKDIFTMLDRDRQRAGATDQELGVQGGTADQTATAARILSSASGKDTRAMVKRLCRTMIVPQVKNLVMLSLVHGKPENQRILSGGKEVRITPKHVEWFLQNANMETANSITMDRENEALKWNDFLNYAVQVLPNLRSPDPMIKALRAGAEMRGIPKHFIDDILPEPGSIDANPVPEMPTTPSPEQGIPNAEMAPTLPPL